MTLVRWQPSHHHNAFDNFNALQHRMYRLFEDFLPATDGELAVCWSPRVDLTEFDDRYEVVAELPGIEREAVKVELSENTLSISGDKADQTEKKERSIYLTERRFGSFKRSFQFTTPVEADKIDASFKDGVLTVSLPKVEKSKPRQVEIKAH